MISAFVDQAVRRPVHLWSIWLKPPTLALVALDIPPTTALRALDPLAADRWNLGLNSRRGYA